MRKGIRDWAKKDWLRNYYGNGREGEGERDENEG